MSGPSGPRPSLESWVRGARAGRMGSTGTAETSDRSRRQLRDEMAAIAAGKVSLRSSMLIDKVAGREQLEHIGADCLLHAVEAAEIEGLGGSCSCSCTMS